MYLIDSGADLHDLDAQDLGEMHESNHEIAVGSPLEPQARLEVYTRAMEVPALVSKDFEGAGLSTELLTAFEADLQTCGSMLRAQRDGTAAFARETRDSLKQLVKDEASCTVKEIHSRTNAAVATMQQPSEALRDQVAREQQLIRTLLLEKSRIQQKLSASSSTLHECMEQVERAKSTREAAMEDIRRQEQRALESSVQNELAEIAALEKENEARVMARVHCVRARVRHWARALKTRAFWRWVQVQQRASLVTKSDRGDGSQHAKGLERQGRAKMVGDDSDYDSKMSKAQIV
eukprot:TRINITY_DN8089_c0_g1_i1.p1 TRINITY_DN8089_c0_g1~~TRINITY_DN8089_c0_g1_i1.p1  ORF type:complete len:292 (+),score=66.43 TRINITY_DN8089_c0_g1_i1:176-1051(+)